MFDYTGRANPDNKFLSMFTYVAFSLSIFCLLLTEALKFYMEHKKKYVLLENDNKNNIFPGEAHTCKTACTGI